MKDKQAEYVRHDDETFIQEASEVTKPDQKELDVEGLDLSIEVVEERISPSETNVFDK